MTLLVLPRNLSHFAKLCHIVSREWAGKDALGWQAISHAMKDLEVAKGCFEPHGDLGWLMTFVLCRHAHPAADSLLSLQKVGCMPCSRLQLHGFCSVHCAGHCKFIACVVHDANPSDAG